LADASTMLASSLDYTTVLTKVARLAVPVMADWCTVHLIEENGSIQQLDIEHVNPQKIAQAYEWQKRYPRDWDAPTGVPNVLRTGRSEYYPDVPDKLLTVTLKDQEQLALARSIGFSSVMIVPMLAHGRTVGAITFVWAESGRHYSVDDLALAEELGRCAGLAVDNARLYYRSQQLNAELEQRVSDRTEQLQAANTKLQREIADRRRAEVAVRTLNAQLEQRVTERTAQLQSINQELKREIAVRKRAQETVRTVLRRTRELYEVSRRISLARTPQDVLDALLSSSYLHSVTRASISLLDRPHSEHEAPPDSGLVLVDWNRDATLPHFAGTRFPLDPASVDVIFPRHRVIQISDVETESQLSRQIRENLRRLNTRSVLLFPLTTSGQWNGAMSFHFESPGVLDRSDIRHVQGLVDQAAVAIHNMRLLENEAEARREAEKANELKLKFLAMISHELRTPLTSIKGFATTLLAADVTWEPEMQHDFIRTINEEADKLTDMIEQLLDLSRLDAGLLRIHPGEFSVYDIVDTAMAQLQTITQHHYLHITLPPDLPHVRADRQRVAQVLVNLVDNAAKYSPADTDITVSAQQTGTGIQIDVRDTGIGIPPQDRQRVFEVFRRGENDSTKRTKGAGLGLAICKGLIEAHGGEIWVQNHAGPGTVMSFTLRTTEHNDY
jgi:signal transduction histidine kinase